VRVQAQAVKGIGESRRWNFSEMQQLKKKVVQTSVDEEHKPTEIFVMLPLDIISVGEFKEGARRSLSPCPVTRPRTIPCDPSRSSAISIHALQKRRDDEACQHAHCCRLTRCCSLQGRGPVLASLCTAHFRPLDALSQILSAGEETSFIHAPSHNAKLLDRHFSTLRKAGAHGVMLDVWCVQYLFAPHLTRQDSTISPG
jgi:hypothetical protein